MTPFFTMAKTPKVNAPVADPEPAPAGAPVPPPEPAPPTPVVPRDPPGPPPASFAELVQTTAGLDTKTYRLARAGDSRELAERVLLLELAPAELKAQATVWLRDYAPAPQG